MRLLIDAGANVNAQDDKKALINAGANVNAQAKDGKTAMSLATEKGHTEIANILRNAGAR